MVESLAHDLRYALRLCVRTPGFTAVAVLALALGIGANTAIFTLVNAVLIERLPFQDPDRLVVVWENNARRPGKPNVISPANFLRWRERATAFQSMAAFYDFRVNLTGSAEPEELAAQYVTPEFFPTLGVSPLIGRVFAPDEGPDGHNRLAVLTYALWQRRFGGDPAIVGRTIQIDGRSVTVIGVMRGDVGLFLKNGTLASKPADLWMPFQFVPAQREPRGRFMTAIARLKDNVPLAQAQAQMTTIAAGLTTQFPLFDTGWGVMLVPIHREIAGELRPALLVLTGAVAFVLLIACANVANLLLARGAVRQREIAIRTALGAARIRVMRQLLTESLVLALAGGTAGLLVAQWSLDLLLALSPVDVAGLARVRLSYPMLAFTAAVSMLTAVVCGFAPAFEGSRADVQESLKDGARQGGSGARTRRLRHAFVVAEIALASVLLVGAGLLLRSFAALRGVNPGFDAHNVLTARVTVPSTRYRTDADRVRFFQRAVNELRGLPGVQAVGAISFLPLAGLGAATRFTIEGQPPPPPGQDFVTDVRVCDDGYFDALRVRLVRGRLFTDREMRENAQVVVVNEAMARRYFAGEDPIGKRVMINMTDPIVPTAIVGIVGDVKYADLSTEPRAMAYWPHPQLAYGGMTLTIRTVSDPLSLAPAVERAIQSIDKDQPVSDVRAMDQWIARSLSQARFASLLLAIFAALALTLSALGIYGVMSYAVSQRTSEIGIRLALGAEKRDILTMIVVNAMRLAAIGLTIGLVLALALNRTVSTLLYQTATTDPLTFALVGIVLGVVAVCASYLPARRASHIAPMEALRYP
jgi:putative ABC transport system permease protein